MGGGGWRERGGVKMGQKRREEGGGTEITIKGLCGSPTTELLGGFGGWESPGCPRGPVALDPASSDLTMPKQGG